MSPRVALAPRAGRVANKGVPIKWFVMRNIAGQVEYVNRKDGQLRTFRTMKGAQRLAREMKGSAS